MNALAPRLVAIMAANANFYPKVEKLVNECGGVRKLFGHFEPTGLEKNGEGRNEVALGDSPAAPYRPSKKSIKRMVEKIHVLTERKGTWQDTTELVDKLNRSAPADGRTTSK